MLASRKICSTGKKKKPRDFKTLSRKGSAVEENVQVIYSLKMVPEYLIIQYFYSYLHHFFPFESNLFSYLFHYYYFFFSLLTFFVTKPLTPLQEDMPQITCWDTASVAWVMPLEGGKDLLWYFLHLAVLVHHVQEVREAHLSAWKKIVYRWDFDRSR